MSILLAVLKENESTTQIQKFWFVKNEFSVSVLSEEEPVGKKKNGVKNKIL